MRDRRAESIEDRLRMLGTRQPRCRVEGCPERDPRALTGVDPDILCAEHRAEANGRRPIEDHHVAGRRNGPATVPLRTNDHAIENSQQAGWPVELLRNPRADPLLRAVASIRGSREVFEIIADRVLATSEAELASLDRFLREMYGEDWHRDFVEWRAHRGR